MAWEHRAPRPIGWSEPGRTTLELKTGGWRTRRPVYVEATAPCRAGCPAGEPVARWIQLARRGDLAAAWALIREENPFPAIMGRVCAHPCESACNRGQYDGAVAINALERFVGDWGLEHGAPPVPELPRPGCVAVVGGGPAGLACAHHLWRHGHRVRLYEADAALGGLLRHGIPEYRLPRAVLEREIELSLGPGLDVLTGQRVGRDVSWETVAAHDAVFLATGAPGPLGLGVPGEGARGVGSGLALLRALAGGQRPPLGRRIVVVGGGSTAMDVARSARRLGSASVVVIALEERGDMPALAEEVSQALAEGVEIRNGLGVLRIVHVEERVTGVAVARARLERGSDGAIRPEFRPGPSEVLAADGVLLAIGQAADLSVLPAALRGERGLVASGADGSTPLPRVFAGGDAASSQRTVTHAIGAGMRAARRIHALLSGARSTAPAAHPGAVALPSHVVAFGEINLAYFSRAPRAERHERPAGGRIGSFVEVAEGLPPASAARESARCFACGRCVDCDNCLVYCPDMAVSRRDGGYRISDDHCKGCGLCVAECPRGALQMVSER